MGLNLADDPSCHMIICSLTSYSDPSGSAVAEISIVWILFGEDRGSLYLIDITGL